MTDPFPLSSEESITLTDRALEIIRHLAGEIGPRPSGSFAEHAAQEYLAALGLAHGYQVHWLPFSFPSFPVYFPYLGIASAAFLLGAGLPGVYRMVLVGLPFLVAALPEVYQLLACLLPHKSSSHNLFLTPQNTGAEQIDCLLVAHVDSARILPSVPRLFQPVFNNLMVIIETLAWMAAAIGILHFTMPSLAESISLITTTFLLVTGVILLCVDLWQQLAGRGCVTSGANDNASGVALCAALLENYISQPVKSICLGVLFTGAEEAGLYGASAFVHDHSNLHAKVINLDMVAQGTRIGLVSRAGRFKPLPTDLTLNRLVLSIRPDVLPVDYKYRAGDFLPFLKAGLSAISLEATDRGGIPSTYHNPTDTPDQIDPLILQQIAKLVQQLMEHPLD